MPGECLGLIVPLGNFSVSVVLLVVMSTPPAVNTPWAITVSLVAVAEVDMNWKCSMPEALLLLGAAVAARVAGQGNRPGGQHGACRHQQAEMVFAHGDDPPGN